MVERENRYVSLEEKKQETEVLNTLYLAEAATDFEKRKLTKLFEYAQENYDKEFTEDELEEAQPLAPKDIKDRLEVALEDSEHKEETMIGVVELLREADLARGIIRAETDSIMKEKVEPVQLEVRRINELKKSDNLSPEELTRVERELDKLHEKLDGMNSLFDYHNESMPILNNVVYKSEDYVSNFFGEAGRRSAENIATHYSKFGKELFYDDELNMQMARVEGKEPDEMFMTADFDAPPYAELLAGMTQNIAKEAILKIRPKKIVEEYDDMSAISRFIDYADLSVYRVFDAVSFGKMGFDFPETIDNQLTEKWSTLKTVPRFREVFTQEQIEDYEAKLTDSLLNDIIKRHNPTKRFKALEHIRSFEALDVVLMATQDAVAHKEQGSLLFQWKRQEGWEDFIDQYDKLRGFDPSSQVEMSVSDSIKTSFRYFNNHDEAQALRDCSKKIAKYVAYDENAPKFKKEYALQHMSDKDILEWGNKNGLIEEVDFEDGKMIAMQLHGRMADLVKQKYRRTGSRTRNDIDAKMSQLISYKKLILDNELDESNAMFLNNSKIVEKFVLDPDNFEKYSVDFMELVKQEGEFLTEYSYEFSELISRHEGLLSLGDLKILKSFNETQGRGCFEKLMKSITGKKIENFSEVLTEDGYLKPEFFDAIEFDREGMLNMYAGREGEAIPQDVWDAAFRARGLRNSHEMKMYFELKPELKFHYERVRYESTSDEYNAIVGNINEYWNQRIDVLAYLHETGFGDFSFDEFRHVSDNRDTRGLVKGLASFGQEGRNLRELMDLKDKLGLNISNITAIDRDLINTLGDQLDDPKKANFYRRMLAEGKGTFRSLVNSIDVNNYSVQLEDEEFQSEVENAVKDLGNIAPRILKMYVESDNAGRGELKAKISEISKRIKKNEPLLEDEQSQEDLQLLAEQISVVFPNNSYDEILNFINIHGLEDRTGDISEFNIREDGYNAIVTEKRKVARLPENQTINIERIAELTSVFDYENEDNEQRLGVALNKILTQGNAISYEEAKQYLGIVLSTMEQHQVIDELRDGGFDYQNPSDVDTLLGKLSEATGIYFDDNIETGLLSRIYDDDKTTAILQNRVKKSEKSLLHIAKYIEDPSAKLKYETAIAQLIADEHPERPGEPMPIVVKADRIATIIKHQLKAKVFEGKNGLYSEIENERSKFEFDEVDQEFSDTLPIKGYVSKNAASFFAKGTAGICTAGDVELYMRDDHFHINLFDGDTAIGNIQAYKIDHDGKKALLFRGFNPSTKYVNRENAPRMTEGMVSIVKQFAEENDIEDVFIAEQLGSWHALTNRSSEGVYDYFEERYLNPDYPGYEKVKKEVSITSTQSIAEMYRVPLGE